MSSTNRVRRGRAGVDEDERFVMSRAEDRSFWMRTAYYAEKYKILVWLAIIALLAFGFDFKTPKMFFQELQSQVTVNKRFVDSVVVPRVDRLDSKTDILLRLRCFDTTLTQQVKDLTGLTDFCEAPRRRSPGQ